MWKKIIEIGAGFRSLLQNVRSDFLWTRCKLTYRALARKQDARRRSLTSHAGHSLPLRWLCWWMIIIINLLHRASCIWARSLCTDCSVSHGQPVSHSASQLPSGVSSVWSHCNSSMRLVVVLFVMTVISAFSWPGRAATHIACGHPRSTAAAARHHAGQVTLRSHRF